MGGIDREKRLRAHCWALGEMGRLFPKPDHLILTNLGNRVEKPHTHVSLFRGEKTDPVILRVYRNETKSVKYSIVDNYRDLVEEAPAMVELLERNGLYVFEKAMS